MKNYKRILALLLSGVLLSNAIFFTTFAVEDEAAVEEESVVIPLADYTSIEYSSPYEKLATMDMYLENDKYQLYGIEETGEIALVTKATGQILFSNPYDLASMSKDANTTETKQKLLSQIQIKYLNGTEEAVMNSYKDAALNRQISFEPIRGGLRVNYTMGREEARILVPEMIEKTRFEEEILEKMPRTDANGKSFVDEYVNKNPYTYMKAYFSLRDANAAGMSEDSKNKLMQTLPITKKYPVYIITPGTSVKEKQNLEHLITTYTDYTFDDLEADYEKVEYEVELDILPLFKLAIEYYLDDEGLRVRVPANDIRFDSTTFYLSSLTILPYFGAGKNDEEGFTLISDGSGALVKFQDAAKADSELTVTGKIYGQDHSFHQVGGANQEVVRLPAFGVIRNMSFPSFNTDAYKAAVAAGEIIEIDDLEALAAKMKSEAEEAEDAEASEEERLEDEAAEDEVQVLPAVSNLPQSSKYVNFNDVVEEKSGYVAYIEEGDALGEITTAHGGRFVHKYNSAYASFITRPSDSYELEGISVSGNATWRVTADRKYTGNFTIRYIPVSGDKATTAGMAEALRNYLVNKGILTKLEDDGNSNIPLYIETFGSINTTKRLAGIPYKTQTPLTTFSDCIDVATELKNGITVDEDTENERILSIPNLVVKYTGWYNGGLYKTVPAKLKIDKAVGGEEGLSELVSYAKENGVEIYPDLEFTYVNKTDSFDGFNYKTDAIQTIDGRTAVHKTYSSLYQLFEPDSQLILSPIAMNKYYDKIADKFKDYGTGAISAATLGSELSADNNDDYPLTREDSKEEVSLLLSKMKEDNGSLLVSGGNAYVLPYADHIINVPLTSSENVFVSESVPFYGMVLHGYMNFAGTAINLDGDYEKSVLKAIENGASPYFILSARNENTSELKSFVDFSKYYSIRYNIWKEDLVKTYNTLNEALSDVKYETIVSHEIPQTRVVRVKYSNGTEFILNYNASPVEIDGVTVDAMGFVKQ